MNTSVTVTDVQFEPAADDLSNACMNVEIASDDHDQDFSVTFHLRNQAGMIDTTVEEGKRRLVALLESALASIRKGGLRRN